MAVKMEQQPGTHALQECAVGLLLGAGAAGSQLRRLEEAAGGALSFLVRLRWLLVFSTAIPAFRGTKETSDHGCSHIHTQLSPYGWKD